MRHYLCAALLLLAAAAQAQPAVPGRGELLYANHCIECHTAQMHWRTLRLARDWDTLKAQVRRWQGVARLNWDEQEVDAVAGYLNDTIYGFPRDEPVRRAAR
ncbi:MAG: c-type cytochrome [Ramlibacter sp.]